MSQVVVPSGIKLVQQYKLGVFALLFLLLAGAGVLASAAYFSRQIPNIPRASAAMRVPAIPTQGPNMTVANGQLDSTLRRVTSQQLALVVNDKTVAIGPETIRDWLQVIKDKVQPVSYIHVNDSAISAAIAVLAQPSLKSPVNPVRLTRADGSSSVIGTGKNGISLGDTAEITKQISQNLLSAKGLQLTVPLQTTAFHTVDATSIDKLLEANVATKEMWAYDKGVLTRHFLISAGAAATPTPIGQFQIYEKLAVQDMRGFNANGTKYFQPHVHWINYFLPGGYAVHGVYWHPLSWFGVNNSSHGCVGLPDAEAEWVYDWAPIGTTVITHA